MKKVLKNKNKELLPLKVTFLFDVNHNAVNLRQNTIHWTLWNEISKRQINGNNEINIVTFRLQQILGIRSVELTKSLSYLKSKKLLKYDSLKRSGAIILLSKEWKDKINWDEIKINRQNAEEIENKMKS